MIPDVWLVENNTKNGRWKKRDKGWSVFPLAVFHACFFFSEVVHLTEYLSVEQTMDWSVSSRKKDIHHPSLPGYKSNNNNNNTSSNNNNNNKFQ